MNILVGLPHAEARSSQGEFSDECFARVGAKQLREGLPMPNEALSATETPPNDRIPNSDLEQFRFSCSFVSTVDEVILDVLATGIQQGISDGVDDFKPVFWSKATDELLDF